MYQKSALLGGDLIKCGLCSYTSAKLTIHVKKEHNISPEEYREKYGSLVCDNSIKRYSAIAKENGSWINRAKESGQDLGEYKAKVSESVSKSIMSNPEERKRRAELLGSLNKTEAFRKKASETAKKTSARIDIQKSRAANLKRWRDSHRKEFLAITSKLLVSKKKTKPEIYIDRWLISNYEGMFKYSQFFYSKKFNTISGKKQVDFLSLDRNIIIEIDGPLHFRESLESFKKIREKDVALSIYSILKQKTLIRVSYDCWAQSTGGFSNATLDRISSIIDSPLPGVHFVGKIWNGNEYSYCTSEEEIIKIYKDTQCQK
jgi:hypothetical protein